MAEPYATRRMFGRRVACVGRDLDGGNGFNGFASRDGEDPCLVRTRHAARSFGAVEASVLGGSDGLIT